MTTAIRQFLRPVACAASAMLLSVQASAAACPDAANAEAAIRHYIEEVYWSAGQREIWKVAAIEDFKFGPIRMGKPTRMVVDLTGPREVCPAKIVFAFTVVRQDKSREVTSMGEGKTFYFYEDEFGEWTFKMG